MFGEVTHCGFSDESKHGRYQSIGLISFPYSYLDVLESVFESRCNKYGFRDLRKVKWHKLSSADLRLCMQDLLDLVIKCVTDHDLRVDVLIWDNQDSRHNIQGRDDAKNMVIMYYHLLFNVVTNRWPEGSVWEICPDRNNEMDWGSLRDILNNQGTYTLIDSDESGKITINLTEKYKMSIAPATPPDSPLIQLADIFAGMATYSRANFEKWKVWESRGQSRLIPFENEISLKRRDRERCAVMNSFKNSCDENKLGVSLNSTQGFRTRQPSNPINFWLYKPQHEKDKAPIH